MTPIVIFNVNKNDNPYEDLHRQNEVIDLLVEKEIPFALGAEIINKKIDMSFVVDRVDFLEDPDMFEMLARMEILRFVVVDRMLNVWVVNGAVEDRRGILVEASEKDALELPWVLYIHETEKYYTVRNEE